MYLRRYQAFTDWRQGVTIVQPPGGGRHLRLEGAGRRIWQLLEYPMTVAEITRKLACEYSGDTGKINEDTSRFLELLKIKGLVEPLAEAPSPTDRQRYRYLHLLKRALVNLIYPEHELRMRFLEKPTAEMNKLDRERFLRDIRYRQPELYEEITDAKQGNGFSKHVPFRYCHTMIGLTGLDHLERCAEQVFLEDIPGDFLEAGVCHGGAAIFLRALQAAHGQESRRVWAADSFRGLPPPESMPDLATGVDLSETKVPQLAFDLEGVRDNFQRYDLLDDRVIFLPGWFAETLPTAPIDRLAILRIDADMYSSTRDVLENLYPRVAPGGFVIIDDYGIFPPCRQAVDEYRAGHNLEDPLAFVNPTVVYWRKGL